MDFKKYLLSALESNLKMLSGTIGDFTDAEMFVRPCPGANHAAWQLGHITAVEAGVQAAVSPSTAVALPAEFLNLYSKQATNADDAARFAPFNTKAQLLELFSNVRGGTITWVKALEPEKFDAPSPEKYKPWAATLGNLAAGQLGHTMMHIGQFQVIRRKLGKPVIF